MIATVTRDREIEMNVVIRRPVVALMSLVQGYKYANIHNTKWVNKLNAMHSQEKQNAVDPRFSIFYWYVVPRHRLSKQFLQEMLQEMVS